MKSAALLATAFAVAFGAPRAEAAALAESILEIEANATRYAHYQPWSSSVRTTFGNGLAVAGERILSTASGLHHATMIRVRKEGRAHWWIAGVMWIDHHANLAMLSVEDDAFWSSTPAASLAEEVPDGGTVRIWSFLDGRVESAPGTVRRIHVPTGPGRLVRHMMLEIASDLESGASSQIVASGGEVIGLAAAGDGPRLDAIPAPLIRGLLERKRGDREATLSWYPFSWQGTENPGTTAYLGLPGAPRGVVVGEVPAGSAFSGHLEPRDLILSIDGFGIESDGDYLDPRYGPLPFSNLATRGKFAGDLSTFEIWRGGRTLSLALPLPRASFSAALVPRRTLEHPPQYAVAGGLVFQPLTADYLRIWGEEWWTAAPFRLRYYTRQSPTPERPHLVVLSQVLPDAFNLGYQDYAFLVVDRINGRVIATLRDVEEALRTPLSGYHVVEFLPNHGPTRLVLDGAGLDEATRRVVRKYGLPAARMIHRDGEGRYGVSGARPAPPGLAGARPSLPPSPLTDSRW